MGTHGKLAITLVNGEHICAERTMDGAQWTGSALEDWIDVEANSRGVWTPKLMLDLDEAKLLVNDYMGHDAQWSHDGDHSGQEGEASYFLHVDYSRRYVGISGALWEELPVVKLGRGWLLVPEWQCPGYEGE
jgi:hypothetical protein